MLFTISPSSVGIFVFSSYPEDAFLSSAAEIASSSLGFAFAFFAGFAFFPVWIWPSCRRRAKRVFPRYGKQRIFLLEFFLLFPQPVLGMFLLELPLFWLILAPLFLLFSVWWILRPHRGFQRQAVCHIFALKKSFFALYIHI